MNCRSGKGSNSLFHYFNTVILPVRVTNADAIRHFHTTKSKVNGFFHVCLYLPLKMHVIVTSWPRSAVIGLDPYSSCTLDVAAIVPVQIQELQIGQCALPFKHTGHQQQIIVFINHFVFSANICCEYYLTDLFIPISLSRLPMSRCLSGNVGVVAFPAWRAQRDCLSRK